MTKTRMPQNDISPIRLTIDERLRLVGEGLDDQTLLWALEDAENSRTYFAISALRAGVYFLAKKATTAHGQWTPYLEGILTQKGQNGKVLPFSAAESARSVRVYMHLAKRFIVMLESRAWEIPSIRAKLDADQTAALQTLAASGPETLATEEAQASLSTFLAGRSVRQLQADLLEAVRAANEEETAKPEGAHASSVQQPAAPAQLDFYDLLETDFIPHLTSLETHLGQPYWADDRYPHAAKLDAVEQVRAKLREIDRTLADRETALRKGA